jgi:hypothetical protein
MDSRPKGLAFFRPLMSFVILTPYEVGTPLSHHDNPSGIFNLRQQMPKLFLIEP